MIKKILKGLVREIDKISNLLETGFKNREAIKHTDCYVTIKKFLRHHQPVVLYDIGANEGSWSLVIHKLNPKLKSVVLFEPQKKYAKTLSDKNYLPGVDKKIYSIALGDEDRIVKIKGGTASASILDTKEQNDFFPNSTTTDYEKISVKRLDEVFMSGKLPLPDTIKIDVQGYELFALKGAQKMLARVPYLIIELSFRDFYDGQPKLSEIISFLEQNNFTLIDFGYEWRGSKNNELLQIDAIFSNTGNHKNYA